jgi:hypothetical protein
VHAFNLTINGKEVEGTYEWEESTWGIDDAIVIENVNDDELTDEEHEAVCEYVYDKFDNI